ncbi:MAG: hypothetical protein K2Q24_02865 [Chitinophagaceae bacterium]|nr:hypothetical protein [Chitinophagaceae bacterium]
MKNRFKSLIETFAIHPQKLFLVDGLGALLTAFLTFVLLIRYTAFFGMPQQPLYILTIIAVLFAIYSIANYYFFSKRWRLFLKLIAIANLLYGCATIILLIFFYSRISIFGWIYFLVELLVIGSLATIELMTASHPPASE